jgi:DNA-binding transcriptional regulator PaaX
MDRRTKALLSRILGQVATGAVVVALAMLSGDPFALYRALGAKSRASRRRMKRAVGYAKKRGWITITETPQTIVAEITREGRKKLWRLQLDRPLAGQKWDGLWRIVIFDVPEKRKLARDTLRFRCKQLGMYQLQKSVWVTPWPCREHIEALRYLYEIPDSVLLIEATTVEGEELLRQRFNLTRS